MGVPKFFRWLSKKYPTILMGCSSSEPSATNPTGEFEPRVFDNIYLDMNGILHNCAHGIVAVEDSEKQMHENFVAKLETIFSVARPRRLLFLALDGVAPRAKMNQQRTRRFMSRLTHSAAKKVAKPQVYINKPYYDVHDEASRAVASMLPMEDIIVKDATTQPTFEFDSNCVTPGTDFMATAASWLHQYAQSKLKSGVWGPEVVIVVSDTSVPGEGEHKIIDWIRRQKAIADRTHLIYGADADLIFLGLALHVPHIHILREGTMPKARGNSNKDHNRKRGRSSRDTIFVSELPPKTTEMELGQLFEQCGPIASVRIISEGHTKANNFGFVKFGRVTASSATERELTEEEAVEVDKAMARAILMNGHRVRGKPIGVDYARGSTTTHISEAEQFKILEQRDLTTVEFMSALGIEDPAIALPCLNLAQWNIEEAQVIYFEFASSGLPLDLFLENRKLLGENTSASPSKPAKSKPQATASPSQVISPQAASSPPIMSPMSPSEHMAVEDAEKEPEEDEDETPAGVDSPYVLVDLSLLQTCFSDRFSRISYSPVTGVPLPPVDEQTPQRVEYKPNMSRVTVPEYAASSSSAPSSTAEAPAVSPIPAEPEPEPIWKSFDIPRVLDDFVLLGMLFGNDFLPGLPAQDIKTGSFNQVLNDYETLLCSDGYLCEFENFDLSRLAKILDLVAVRERAAVRKKIISTRKHAMQQKKKAERAEKAKETPKILSEVLSMFSTAPAPVDSPVTVAPESDVSSPATSVPVTPTPDQALLLSPEPPKSEDSSASASPAPESPSKQGPRRRRGSKEPAPGELGAGGLLYAPKPRLPWVQRDAVPEPTDADHVERRAQYYKDNFPEIDFSGLETPEAKLEHARRTICVEYLRGISWVMRYYFLGCQSWEWYYPHHYAPFAVDVAQALREMVATHSQSSSSASNDTSSATGANQALAGPTSNQLFQFELFQPFRPLEQLVAVLPPDSIMILPKPLRQLVTEPSSPLHPYFPAELHIQKSDGISQAVAKWHGVLRLPFIPRQVLLDAVKPILKQLDLTEAARNQFYQNVAYFGASNPLYEVCQTLPSFVPQKNAETELTTSQEKANSQQIIDSLFEMPMQNVRLSPQLKKGHLTLTFDITPVP